MFKKVVGRKITTYNPEGDWYIDVIETDDMFEAWIYLGSYGIKSLMWGSPKQQEYGTVTRKDFLDMVKANFISYANGYVEEFAPEEME